MLQLLEFDNLAKHVTKLTKVMFLPKCLAWASERYDLIVKHQRNKLHR